MNPGSKYVPYPTVDLPDRRWPMRTVTKAPVWCSVDLRDGNQALVVPMNLDEKLLMFKLLCDVGFKEIEVGFPSANDTEYAILRRLIEGGHVPDDVALQVLVQSRRHLIEKTFDAVEGAKNVILHFYNSTSALQRKVVFKTGRQGIIDIALEGAKVIGERAQQAVEAGMNLRLEYSPESFSGTEPDFAVEICARVMEELGSTPENPLILNLPNTVEVASANVYADQVEYFCRNLPHPESAVISIHPHNDRGTGVAGAELAMLAGAQRVEGTLFGNGERTGNVDIVTLALNLFTQGVDPGLDFSDINNVREIYEHCTKMLVPPRHPYAGELVFTAFSGSHQDAISKGVDWMQKQGGELWEIPYLPIDPADLGREYEPIIRINSQSGKGGAAFVLKTYYGLFLPREMHPEFGAIVKAASDRKGDELSKEDIYALFEQEYLNAHGPIRLRDHHLSEEAHNGDENPVRFTGKVETSGGTFDVAADGNGPLDAFLRALAEAGVKGYDILSYSEHAITKGSDSRAIAYTQLSGPDGRTAFGAGTSSNINLASIRSVLSAVNRLSGATQ